MKNLYFSKFQFKCTLCGDCCYNALVKSKLNIYSYNYNGKFVFNPRTSITVNYNEKPQLEKNLKQKYNLSPRLYPYLVFFLKDFPFGFIYEYQIGVKKNKFCMFYNINTRKCKIFPIRPAVCKYHPLVFNPDKLKIPKFEVECTAILNNLLKKNLKEGDKFKLEYPDNLIKSAFPLEYEIFLNTRYYWFCKHAFLMESLCSLFIYSEEITPKLVKDYKLLDFNNFIKWGNKNLINTKFALNFKKYKQELPNLKKKDLTLLKS